MVTAFLYYSFILLIYRLGCDPININKSKLYIGDHLLLFNIILFYINDRHNISNIRYKIYRCGSLNIRSQ